MSYGLKQSQLIIKPLADATKGAIEFNRDVTGNPTDNVILQDVYLGDNETMVYNPNTGLVTGVVSHFKTAFINGQDTNNSEYAVVASTLDGTSTPTTFTPSYFQVGQFAVTSGTLTDFGLGGTAEVSISAGQSLGHIDLLDNFVVMHPQSASIPGVAPKDMGLVFSKNADSSAAFYLDHTNGQFYLHNIAHADSKLDLHDLSVTSGTLSLATLNVGALNINGTPVTGGIDHFVDLTDVNVSLVDGEFVVYNADTEVFTNRSVSSTYRLDLKDILTVPSFDLKDTISGSSTGALTDKGSFHDYSIPAFTDLETNYIVTTTNSNYRIELPLLSTMSSRRSSKITINNDGPNPLEVLTSGSDVFQSGKNKVTLYSQDSVTFIVDGDGSGEGGVPTYKMISSKYRDALISLNVTGVVGLEATYDITSYLDHNYVTDTLADPNGLAINSGYYLYAIPEFYEQHLNVLVNTSVAPVGVQLPSVGGVSPLNENQTITIKATGSANIGVITFAGEHFEDVSGALTLRPGDSITVQKSIYGTGNWKVVSSYRNSLSQYVELSNDGDWLLDGSSVVAGTTLDLGETSIYDPAFTQEEAIFVLTDDTGSAGDLTITLFSAAVVPSGFKVIVKRANATRLLTIDGATTQLIDGETTIELPLQYSSVTLVSNGVNAWHIL